ncbi:peptidylprolyl isomerase [Rubrivirga sp. IMCC43871]|uniref:peptidylprolyl isomerase n=1 Tax=Rubrivirga sp. IMCC43871 TaxID=3391575 RepID=UPI00398F9946
MSPIRLALLTLVAATLAACGGSRPATEAPMIGPDGTPIVATWTADTLSLLEFDRAYTAADGTVEDSVRTPIERRLDFLDRYVDFRLKVLAAREAGYADDSAYVAEVADYRDQLAGPYFTDRRVLTGIVRDIYDKQAERVEVSHILFLLSPAAPDTAATFARASALRDSINAGLIAFDEAAFRYSEDPTAPQNRGALGFITGGRTVLDFENAVYATPIGEVSEPVRTRFGVHLVKPTDRQPAKEEIRARHILIRTDETVSVDSARTVILGLRDRIEAGEDFAALAREFSDDPGSGAKGGDLGVFGRRQMVPPFEEAAFALENAGDLSGPVETRFGIHLIQLTEVADRPSFDEAYDELRELALRLPRTAVRRQAVGREYIEEEGGSYDEALVRRAVEQYPADSLLLYVARDGFGRLGEETFATVGDSTFTLSELAPLLARMRYGPHPAGEMIEAARAFVDERAVEQAVARLEERDPEFARVFRSYADGVLLFRVAEDSVWTPARNDNAGLRAYYDSRPGAFRWPERRRVLAFRSTSDSLLRRVAVDLDAGMTPSEALEARAEFMSRSVLRLDTVFVADSSGSPLDAVLALEVGERSEVSLDRSQRVLYRLDAIEPPRTKTFDESRAEVITGYQDVVEDAWETRLRARYNAHVYPERVPAESSVPREARRTGQPALVGADE